MRNANDQKSKRAVNGQPLDLYVEVLIVADYSVLQKHRLIINSNDDNVVMQNMKIYFIHLINGVRNA